MNVQTLDGWFGCSLIGPANDLAMTGPSVGLIDSLSPETVDAFNSTVTQVKHDEQLLVSFQQLDQEDRNLFLEVYSGDSFTLSL